MKKLLLALLIAFSTTLLASAQSYSNPLIDRAWKLNQEGTALLAKGDANRALALWEQANKLYTQAQDTEGIIGTQIKH